MSKNQFAWASIGENGKATGGKPGDQTGREVKVGEYYNFGQDRVIRFKSVLKGRKAAKIARQLAENPNIGYNQKERYSLYRLANDCKWNVSALIDALNIYPVNCDCSSFVATVINLTFGYKLVDCFTTATMEKNIYSECPTYFKGLTVAEASKKWHKGDMPLKAYKHVIINV